MLRSLTGECLSADSGRSRTIDAYPAWERDSWHVKGVGVASARGVYALVGEEANSLLRIYSNVGAIEVPRYKAVQVPSGSLKSFLIENKTLELVFEERVSQVYANQQQFREYIQGNGYVVTENVLRKIYAENQVPFYAKATYFPK